jgi:hypothetical protein
LSLRQALFQAQLRSKRKDWTTQAPVKMLDFTNKKRGLNEPIL